MRLNNEKFMMILNIICEFGENDESVPFNYCSDFMIKARWLLIILVIYQAKLVNFTHIQESYLKWLCFLLFIYSIVEKRRITHLPSLSKYIYLCLSYPPFIRANRYPE